MTATRIKEKIPQTSVNDHKRGSAITFFDESENENGGDTKKYDEMNTTLDAFKRPSKKSGVVDKVVVT